MASPGFAPAANGRTGFSRKQERSSSSSSSGLKLGAKKKKMTIKPFKITPKLPETFEQDTWAKLQAAVHAVHAQQMSALSREELYRSVEDMCTWKMAARLYTRLEETCAVHVRGRVEELLQYTGGDMNLFLEAVHKLWEDHCEDMLVIRTIFLYLDRTYVMQTPHIASIWDMGLNLVRDNLVERRSLETKLIDALLELVELERKGEASNRSYLYNLLRMLLSLHLYHADFETPFLTASERFYLQEGATTVESASVPQFLVHVEKRLYEENERVNSYLDSSTKKQLISVVESKLLKPHVTTLLERGFETLMEEGRIEDLKRMYALFARVDAINDLKTAFSNYIQKNVSKLVMDDQQEKTFVEKVLKLKADLDAVLSDSFQSNTDFSFAMKSAMENAINVRANRPAELVAKFVDSKLRTGNKGGSEAEVENLLDRVMVIFRYIQGKDVFEAFYKKDLAKRLLVGKSASFDLEKLMLSKLKTECGSSFTNKLEGMFKDIDLSQNVMTQFQQHAASRHELEVLHGNRGIPDMQVQVLTTGFWPPYAAVEINLPAALVPLKDIFDKFYSSKYQGRQLQWQHSLAQCVVKATFPSGKKELVVSLYQTVVLLCFNGADSLGFKEIKEQTRIEDGELRRTLQSLACGKTRVLQKVPKGKEVNDDDSFVFNTTFTNQFIRIKINSIQMKETKKENEDTHERVFRDRQYQVDAAIVRIMKARKKLSHALLMTEIFTQVRFPAKAADIKRRIESLIDREYLERDQTNAQMYNYLA
ncbi:Cullin-4 [Phytophthora fragariae]|uniref:Cullin-4 n=1 Tax=Phytophthora fragariae TaxID=53985 RepID=A0A6A3YV86_9STRA|nr:Cullin-4 [Phytophthora fragariae]KAE8943809.1 Cullin-4 [Phytophthora fragariae]KAE9125234.1 Cullin-4 [Phytophthora fragariae]KAE9150316.1 Cullin-4 [Phytophthora fragariae]KAE9223470.1 Cullin-4 [Phytophthora fragariae]